MDKDQNRKDWNGQSRGGRFGYLFFIKVIQILGIRFAYVFLGLILVYFIPFAPKATAAIWTYHRKILGHGWVRSIAGLFRHYYVFGQTLIDKIAMQGGAAHKYHFEFEHYEQFEALMKKQEGLVIIGAHVGCWEAAAGFFGKSSKKINIVMFDAEHQQIKEVLSENSGDRPFEIISVNNDTLGAMIQIKCALNSGEYVCFNGDRYLDRNSAKEVDLMGSPAFLPIGPFLIAHKCRVPVVFFYAMREKNRTYRFIFQEAVPDRRAGYVELQNQYVASLEKLIRNYPSQWFNFYRFWNN